VAAKADVNQSNLQGVTPLLAAVQNGNEDLVKTVLVPGVSIYGKSAGVSPLVAAALSGKGIIVDILFKHSPLDNDDNNKLSEYYDNVRMRKSTAGQQTVVLQEQQQAIDSMLAAANKGYTDIVVRFVEEGLSLNSTSMEGNTVAHLAAFENKIDTMKYVVQQSENVNLNQENNKGSTALFLASEKGYIDIVNLLIDIGHVDVNKSNLAGVSPLQIAEYNKYGDVVKKILQCGVNHNSF